MTQYLVFDIGGTNVKYALMDGEGKLLEKGKRASADNLEDFVAVLYAIGDQYKGKFAGIAVCAPGKIDTEKKIIHFGGALPFLDGLNLEETLGARYGVPVGAENDGKAAALCEQWLGELKGVDTGAVLTLGTGVGGGIVAGGKLLHGSSFQAGELSWMITNQGAGLKKMDAYAGFACSAVGMVEKVNRQLGNEDVNDGLAAFEAIKSGNEEAVKIFRQYCLSVAVMILNLQAVINGEKVVIGGGISAQEILIEEIRRQFGEILNDNPMLRQQVTPPEIVAAKFRNDTNLYGALFALLQENEK
ncbi:transcriptional regulator [Lactobacillus nasalidis]|uniref:Transcriptional regulator n=1 Tax=Lactobacillus nasalidis TaxID=2797258 RepID=A0ABQ3W354_9LACO|nr:ROK family protein [Lactobacillus nasalidis]GHV98342.1 transcriptional regulator [Lactobacillus nasalidis]GHV99334.1 transcriptional regulator [Lactobacillus nasalidis]GHW00803.1 transcriptional regulator [Lactobacillus nasalidis]